MDEFEFCVVYMFVLGTILLLAIEEVNLRMKLPPDLALLSTPHSVLHSLR